MLRSFRDLQPFRRDPLQFMLNCGVTATQPLVRLALGPKPVWLATQPDVVRAILKAEERQIDKGRFIHKLRLVMGTSSLTLSGEEHRRIRHVLHANFARGTANQLVPQMSAIVRKTAAQLARAESFDAHDVTAPLTVRLICAVMFGKDVLSSGDEQAIVHAVSLVEDDLADEMFRVLPRTPWAAMIVRRRRKQARSILDFVIRRVRDRADESSAINALIGLGLTDVQIRDELVTMLLAGHHTTGSAAAWILYYLAVLPDIAEKIADEANSLTSVSGEISAADLPKASVSQAIVREVLRLYPSAHWFSRDVQTPMQIEGVSLKAGDAIIISPWHLHRDPRYWDEPSKFRIDRPFNNRAYLPFGAGPRACLGMGIALLELQLLALELAAAFKLEITSPVPAPLPAPSITLIPPEIRLVAKVRAGRPGIAVAAA